ncbi:MAG: WD40 repeat domain-containing protein, partial [Sphingobacteriaceae bacterium]
DSSRPITEIKSKSQWVNFAEWSHDGNYFATAEGNTVRIFDSKGKQINCFSKHESTVSGIQWKKDTHQLATACYGGVRLYEVGNDKQVYFFEWKNSMLSLSWSPDGKFIGCGTQDSRVHFFPLPYAHGSDFEMNGYRGKVKTMDWTTDSNYFLTNCWNEIVVWKFAGKSPQGQTPIILDSHLEKITQATFQNKGSFLASGDELGFLMFYDVEIGEKAITGAKLKHAVSKLKWSNDNSLLAAGTANGELIIMESPI